MHNTCLIREVKATDAVALVEIYNHYVKCTHVTFDEDPLPLHDMQQTIAEASASVPFLVLENHGLILGYALSSKWKSRCAYKHSLETSVYLHPEEQGKGYGSLLYTGLLKQLRGADVHALIGGIALPNEASIRLHEKLGFKKTGVFKEVGYKFGKWIDVGYWQLIF
jgi:L-amino acid N-acyltransferase YncA